MATLNINLEGDGAWPDLAERHITKLDDEYMEVAVMPEGMSSGLPSVMFRFDLDETDAASEKSRTMVAETSARNIVVLARMIEARYPDLMAD